MYLLTERQKEIYEFLACYLSENGQPPTVREIAEHFNLNSKATIAKHLEALERRGVIKKHKLIHRGIELTAQKKEIKIEIRGVVKAGQPIECYEVIEDFIATPGMFKRPEKVFGLRVSGDSMIDAGIWDGDIIFIEETNFAENGKIVLATVDGGQTLKRLYREEGRVRLQPENKDLKPIYVMPNQSFWVHGILVGMWRLF